MRKILFCLIGIFLLSGAGCQANAPQSAVQSKDSAIAPADNQPAIPINAEEKFPLTASLVDDKKLSVAVIKPGVGLEGLDWLAVLNIGRISSDRKMFVIYKNYNFYRYGDKAVYVKLDDERQSAGIWYGPFKISVDQLIAELEKISIGQFIKTDLQLVSLKPMWKISSKNKINKLVEGEKIKFSLDFPQYFKETETNVFDLPVNDPSFCLKYDICKTNLTSAKISFSVNEQICPAQTYGNEISISDFVQARSNSILPDEIKIKNLSAPLKLKMYSNHAMNQEELYFMYEGSVAKGCVRAILTTHSFNPAIETNKNNVDFYDPVAMQKIFLDDFLADISFLK